MLTQLGIAKVLLDTRPIYNSPDDPPQNNLDALLPWEEFELPPTQLKLF
jgi:hypothetical protein